MKAILIDDEVLALKFLKHQLKNFKQIDIIGAFSDFSIEKNINHLKKLDVVFLDIEMPEINGIELAEKIIEINSTITIIFVTAFNEYAVEAFELNAMDYLIKPVQVSRLKKTIDRIESNMAEQIEKQPKVDEQLQISVSKELSFKLPESEVEYVQWRTSKSKELFLYLLHHQQETVRKSKLIDLIWSDFPEDRAYSQLYTAIYHIRKTLHKFSDYFSIKNVGEGYILTIINAKVDLVQWEKGIKSSSSLNHNNITNYENIMKLYRGAYLQEADYLWIEAEQYRLERLWIRTAYQIASYYTQQIQHEKSEYWYRKICAICPEEEDAHFALMKLYRKLGLELQLERQFEQLKIAMNELNLRINPDILKWLD